MSLEDLEYKAKLAEATFPEWTSNLVSPDHETLSTFPWMKVFKGSACLPTIAADHISAASPFEVMKLIEGIRERDTLIERVKEFALAISTGHHDWTDPDAVTHREVKIAIPTIQKAVLWLTELKRLPTK
jgi:hypothetical protein